MKYFVSLLLVLMLQTGSFGQGMAFGFKGGPSIGFQKWNTGSQRDALFAYHGIAFVESLAEQDEFAIFAQTGFHVKGGAVRYNRFTYFDNSNNLREFGGRTDRYEFRNLSLTVGGKQKFDKDNLSYYYLFGMRGEFTLGTNLDEYQENFPVGIANYFPTDTYVRRINYGVTVGGGFEFVFSDFVSGIIELTVNPDFSKQYRRFAIDNVYNPYSMQNGTLPEQELSNTTIELSVGMRFIRKVEYID